MKKNLLIVMLAGVITSNAQLINKRFNQSQNQYKQQEQSGISSNGYVTDINIKVIYNALPDGYHITFTNSFIAESVEKVEVKLNREMTELAKALKKVGVSEKEMLVDIISLDPLFETSYNDTSEIIPSGYKIAQNITINAEHISEVRPIVSVCLDHHIFDVIDVKAYLKNSKTIYDSLKVKSIEVLESKKELCTGLGYSFSGGKSSFQKYKDVIYPSERYLKSFVSNANLYKHHISQNSSVNVNRQLDVDNYYNLNLKNADFVFHGEETDPVIQFYYEIDYTYFKKNHEKIAEEKAQRKEEKDRQKIYYILDEKGEIKKIDIK